jgi:hypothetical protein
MWFSQCWQAVPRPTLLWQFGLPAKQSGSNPEMLRKGTNGAVMCKDRRLTLKTLPDQGRLLPVASVVEIPRAPNRHTPAKDGTSEVGIKVHRSHIPSCGGLGVSCLQDHAKESFEASMICIVEANRCSRVRTARNHNWHGPITLTTCEVAFNEGCFTRSVGINVQSGLCAFRVRSTSSPISWILSSWSLGSIIAGKQQWAGPMVTDHRTTS